MSSKTPQMNEELKQAVKEMNEASDLMDKVVKTGTFEPTGTTVDQVAEIKTKMKKPEWLMNTVNTVEGVIAGEPIKLVIEIDFVLDSQSLFEALDRQKTVNKVALEQISTELKNQEKGTELTEILVDALLPHAYGITRRLVIKESLPESNLGEVEEITAMLADEGLVHFNYAHVLSRFLPVQINLNDKLFQSKCWVNEEFLRDNEPFEKSFSFQDDSNGQPLLISLITKFSRL
jgi:hypothetical protein